MFLDRVIHFGETLGDQVKGRSPKKLKSLIGSQCSPRESTCSKLQYNPYLISVACSNTELSISDKIWVKVRVRSPKKLNILIEVP